MASVPGRGKKMADLLRRNSTWASNLEETASRWYRLPTYMTEKNFDLSSLKSCIGVIPLARKASIGSEKFYYAAQLLFQKSHEKFDADYVSAVNITTKNGKVFHATDAATVWDPEQRLYLSGLPKGVELADLRTSLMEYAEFAPSTAMIYHLSDKMYSGRVMLIVKKILKVPAKRLPILAGPHENVCFSVIAKGYADITPKDKTTKPCFCCKSTDHEVKNCPTKKSMTFSWKCADCGFRTLKCYEGNCAFDRMVLDLEGMKDKAISSQPSTRAMSGSRLGDTTKILDDGNRFLLATKGNLRRQLETNVKQEDLKEVDHLEKQARAFKRYFYRSYKAWAADEKKLHDVRPFRDLFATLNTRIFGSGKDYTTTYVATADVFEDVTIDEDL